MIPSESAEASRAPSGLKTASKTSLVWPVSEKHSRPVAASQIVTARSWLAEASRAPSGLNATFWTRPRWPWMVQVGCPVVTSQTRTLPS
jgi:hypothetical protein